MKMKTVILTPLCFQRPCESSVNPTEMPNTSENYNNVGGGEEGELQLFIVHIVFALGKRISIQFQFKFNY